MFAASSSAIRSVYGDWGQFAPTTQQLADGQAALFNLDYAWKTLQSATPDQAAAVAGSYVAPTGTYSMQAEIAALAASNQQALSLIGSVVTTPLMQQADTVSDARTLLAQGGEPLLASVVDQASVLTEEVNLQSSTIPGCDGATFKAQHAVTVANPAIGDANVAYGHANYKAGIAWGASPKTSQGLPYEAWVQQNLDRAYPPGQSKFTWLKDFKTNWKVFDHWNSTTGNAVNDKTLNTQAVTYLNTPSTITARIDAYVNKMIGYEADTSADGKNTFSVGDIDTYTINLAVPSATASTQWTAICRAYQFAETTVTATGKTLTFNINNIVG